MRGSERIRRCLASSSKLSPLRIGSCIKPSHLRRRLRRIVQSIESLRRSANFSRRQSKHAIQTAFPCSFKQPLKSKRLTVMSAVRSNLSSRYSSLRPSLKIVTKILRNGFAHFAKSKSVCARYTKIGLQILTRPRKSTSLKMNCRSKSNITSSESRN